MMSVTRKFFDFREERTMVRIAVLVIAVLAVAVAGAVQAQTTAVVGATVHTMSGEPFEGVVVIEDGVITELGPSVAVPAGAARIDAAGLHVYPGFFDALSQVGLQEIGSISATVDTTEMGRYNPHLTAATAIHPASEVIPVTRANGVTHSLVAPAAGGGRRGGEAGVIPGRAALVHMDGWTVEEMALDPSAAMVINWPVIRTRSFDFATFSVTNAPYAEAKKEADEAIAELEDWFDAAEHYRQATASGSRRTERNLELEWLAKTLDGGMKVVILANGKAEIEAAMAFAERRSLDWILAGGRDAWKVKAELAESQTPVILGFVGATPPQDDDDYDRAYKTAAELHAAGVKIAFASGAGGGGGPGGPHDSRTLPFEAGFAVGYGLPREAAIAALTRNPAEMLGVGEQIGTLEKGKAANLLIVDGDPLDFTGKVVRVMIGGRDVGVENRHLELYERYRSRPLTR